MLSNTSLDTSPAPLRDAGSHRSIRHSPQIHLTPLSASLENLKRLSQRAAEVSILPSAKELFTGLIDTPEYRQLALSGAAAYENLASLVTNPDRCPTRTGKALHGLKDCHVSALSVSALVGRVLHIQDRPKDTVLHAARELFLTIPEDTGASDTPHNVLYDRFASSYCPDWQSSKYKLPLCAEVARHVRAERTGLSVEPTRPQEFSTEQSAENVRAGLELTVVSEFWNGAEYTHGTKVLVQAVRSHATTLGLKPEEITPHLRYFWCHAGATELGHYNHALNALHTLGLFQPERLSQSAVKYMKTLGAAFEEIANG